MTGKSHMTVNTCAVIQAACASACLPHVQLEAFAPVKTLFQSLDSLFFGPSVGAARVFTFVAGFCLYLLGSLLPDIDSDTSMIGRHFCLPLGHRTWTHSVWALALLYLLARRWHIVYWLLAGYALHLVWDSVSTMGVCWLWPLSQYKEYPGGAKVAYGHNVRIYRTGDVSEIAVDVMVVLFTFICVGLTFAYVKGTPV